MNILIKTKGIVMDKHRINGLSYMAVTILFYFGCTVPASADLLSFQGQYQSELEERSAVSNQAVYDQLKAGGCNDSDRVASTNCSGTAFVVWNNVRELVHTANELDDSGPTNFSLDSDLQGLGFSLQWTAGEEFSSEESLLDSFVSGQLSGLTARISALRSGASGFQVAGKPANGNGNVSGLDAFQQSGLNAGDEVNNSWSRWGGFLNGSYTWGYQDPTEREAAFDFDGSEINAGIDYRLDDHWVVGGLFGHMTQEIDFDSAKSIVDGGVEMDGYSSLLPGTSPSLTTSSASP
jgi:hypothetical protein